jgi:endonuclease/exonuclease/phosphatase family metal-dependent hydrolase
MRLISWNIEHPTEIVDIERIIQVLRGAKPDVVAFQEVPRRLPKELLEGLSRLGLQHYHDFKQPRGWGLLLSSKWPLDLLNGAVIQIPGDEKEYFRGRIPACDGSPARLLSVLVKRPKDNLEVHTVHVPPGTRVGWRKIDTLRAIARRMAEPSVYPRILCGDFNEPRAELPGGEVVSGAEYNQYARVNKKRWQEAVESIFVGLPKKGMRDVFRAVHRESVRELVSHRLRKSGNPRRYDHVFATLSLEPRVARYLPEELWAGVSDHAPAEVVFRNPRN